MFLHLFKNSRKKCKQLTTPGNILCSKDVPRVAKGRRKCLDNVMEYSTRFHLRISDILGECPRLVLIRSCGTMREMVNTKPCKVYLSLRRLKHLASKNVHRFPLGSHGSKLPVSRNRDAGGCKRHWEVVESCHQLTRQCSSDETEIGFLFPSRLRVRRLSLLYRNKHWRYDLPVL